jgi:hypothetical protein
MSESDHIFSRNSKRATSSSETRHIVTAPRKSRSGTMTNRVVEVVHVARGTPRPLKEHPHPVRRDAHAESWPDGFRAMPTSPVPAPEAQPVVPELTSPAVHVMPAWEPSVQQPASTNEEPAELPSSAATIEHREQRDAESNALKVTTRRFADPFAADDDGANCTRCGYLIEQARERRGLWTCSKCG